MDDWLELLPGAVLLALSFQRRQGFTRRDVTFLAFQTSWTEAHYTRPGCF